MPRRKGTRQANARAKPKLNKLDLETSMTLEERKHKLSVYIADFRIEVEKRKEEIIREAKNITSRIAHQYNIELLKLPKSVREMSVADLFAQGGFPTIVVSQSDDTIPDTRNPLTALENKLQTPAQSRPKVNEVEPPSTGRVLRPRKTTARNTKGNAVNTKSTTANPATIKATRTTARIKKQAVNPMTTPATAAYDFAFDTPAITPKFDPRLPLIGKVRDPRAGERIMSMTGSPLTNKNLGNIKDAQLAISAGDGQTLYINPDLEMSPRSISAMGDDAKQQLLLLHQKLSSLVQNINQEK